MTTGRRVVTARSLIDEAGLPEHEAARLLQKATGRNRTELAREPAVDRRDADRFAELAGRRLRGEPLQYIEGSSQFGPIEVAVDSRVLIPRPETEQLWELVVARLAGTSPHVIVDLGTGSANLAIALKHSFPAAHVHAVDISPDAVAVARENVSASGLQVTVYQGDLFGALPESLLGEVDLLVSNPPYIACGESESLPIEVRDHEPAVALFAGEDGLEVLRRIISAAPEWLRPGGLLACEIGAGQRAAVEELASGLTKEVIKDLSGRDRFLIAQKGME